MLSNGKYTSTLSLPWFSNIAFQNLVFYYCGSLQQTSGLVIPKREMLDSIVTKYFVPPFFLHTREEQGDGRTSPTLLISFLIHPV